MVYVSTIKGKGRGVFAQQTIHKGEVFERAPVIVIPDLEWGNLERTVLFHYCYSWGENSALALGFGSLFNHSYHPNAMYNRKFAEQVIEYMALCDIQPGEEITVNYNGDPNDLDPLWFAVRE